MNRGSIIQNLIKRNGDTLEHAEKAYQEMVSAKEIMTKTPSAESRSALVRAASKFPNMTHPAVLDLESPKEIYQSDKWKPKFSPDPDKHQYARPFEEVAKALGYPVRTINTGQVATEKSYFLYNQIAQLEQALIRYTVDRLVKRHGFKLISVPDLLHPDVIQRCGMDVAGDISQVFKLDPRHCGQVALSGTAEMALGGFFQDKTIKFSSGQTSHPSKSRNNEKFNDIQRFVAVSRCYRAESSGGRRESGIYRVHHFTKVEMFAVMPGLLEISSLAHQQFLDIQKQLFEGLDIHFKVLDMPPDELGHPAYRKYDIEALYPGRKDAFKKVKESPNGEDGELYGEISSCSNCTDYQARRLNIRDEETGGFVHTINGTACAVPRMIMALVEQHQTFAPFGVPLPEKLHKFMPRNATKLDVLRKKDRVRTVYVKSQKTIKAKLSVPTRKN